MSFDKIVPNCDVYAAGKSYELVYLKTAEHKANQPLELACTDLVGPITPEALGGYKNVSKNSDQNTKWAENYLLKSKSDALSTFSSFM